MSFDVNKVILIGRVGRDPETKNVGGKEVVNFSVATSYGSKEKSTERTEWHQVSAWEKLGEIATKILHKGDKVYVEGRISYNTTGEGDAKRTFTQITATNLINLSGKPAGAGSSATTTSNGAGAAAPADEDIPF